MNLRFWRRPKPRAPINADFNLRAVTVTIPFLGECGDVISLLDKKMDDAARSMAEMLNSQRGTGARGAA